MRKFAGYILDFISRIIILLKIQELNYFYSRFKNRICSNILKLKIKSNHKIFLQTPFLIFGEKNISLEGSFFSLPGLRIECIEKYNGDFFSPRLEIGKNVSFNQNCHIGCINYIRIGANVLIGSNVLITDHSHGATNNTDIIPSKRPLYSKGPVIIGDNTWICENVCILPNVRIGCNCIVGAGAVVSKDIPDDCIAVGNPARIIKR